MKPLTIVILAFCVFQSMSACKEPGEIQVKNNLPHALLHNVEWGDVALTATLMPGETSHFTTIYNYDSRINLPESHPLRFYLDVNGDMVFLETRAQYLVDFEMLTLAVIDDTTAVFTPYQGDGNLETREKKERRTMRLSELCNTGK